MSEMSNKPRTWFAGESSPEDQKKTQETKFIALGLFVLAFPAAAVIFGIQFLLFSVARISHKVLFSIALAYTLVLSATGLIVSAVQNYLSSFVNLFESTKDNGFEISSVLSLLWNQLPLSIVIGGLAGAIYSWWRFFRRPAWEQVQFRRTPREFLRRRKNINDIQADVRGPSDGMTLGINDHTGEKKIQTFKEASAHTFVVGGSGTGKTVTMLTRARDVIKSGRAYVMLDLKGSRPLANDLYELSQRYNRPFYHFSIASPRDLEATPDPQGLAFYQPVYRGDASRRKDLVLSLRSTWSEEHYEILAAEYLQTAMNVAIANPPSDMSDAFLDIIKLLDPQVLSIRSQGIPQNYPDAMRIKEAAQQLAGASRRDTADSVRGIRGIVGGLRDSTAGHWLRSAVHEGEREIDLYKAADEGAVVLFTIDTSTYEKVGKQIANLIIQDMKTVSAEMRLKPAAHPLHFDIDEFSALDGAHVINLINKCRDADIPVTLTTQALGDLAKISPIFKDQLLGIIANFIIHRANTEEDAKIYAGLTGVGKKWDVRYSVEQTSGSILGGVGKGAATGSGMVNEVEDYNVPFGDIMKLEQGQIIYVCKSPNRLEHIRVIKEEGLSLPSSIGASPLQKRSQDVLSSRNQAAQLERLQAPLIESPTQPRITAGLPQDEAEVHPEIHIKRSSGFIGDIDLNAALHGKQSLENNQSPDNLQEEPPKSLSAPSLPIPTKVPASSTTPVTPPMRPQRPSSPSSGGIPSRPALPSTTQLPSPDPDRPHIQKPVSAKKKSDVQKKELTDEW